MESMSFFASKEPSSGGVSGGVIGGFETSIWKESMPSNCNSAVVEPP